MHHPTSVRPNRPTLFLVFAAWLCLAGASFAAPQPPPSWADLLAPHPGEQLPQDPTSPFGVAVEVHSKALTRGTPQLHIQTFDGRVYQADLDHLSWNGQGVITWEGRVSALGVSCPVLLSAHGGCVAGVIDTPNGRYELIPTADGHLLKRSAGSHFGSCHLAKDQIALNIP